MEPERIEDLFAGLADRVQRWRREQPWYPLLHSNDPETRELGRAQFLAAWEQYEREAATAGTKYLASKERIETAALLEDLGIGAALGPACRAPSQVPAQKAIQGWWNRGKKPVFLMLGASRMAALEPAAWVVYKAHGRMVTAGEFARRQFDDAYLQRLLGKRLVAVIDVFAGPVDPKGYFENTLREFIQLRCASALKTVITTPLDRTAWLATCGTALRALIAEQVDGQEQRTKVTDRKVELAETPETEES